jgi:Flp pilus assembly pilin Flp
MMNWIKKLIKDDHGAVTVEMVALTSVAMALSAVLFATVQHELAWHLATLEAALNTTTRVD